MRLDPEAPAQAARPLARGRVPGPDDLAQSGADHRHPADRDAAGASRARRRGGAASAASNCWPRSAFPRPEQRLTQYPHQLSGGMRQRVAIAIALSCEPKLLIADEPTTALDVTIQAQILDLLAREQRRRHMAMILITHDLGVVAGRTDEVAVMYAGRVVERAPTPALFKKMRMPYTEALLAAIPKLDAAAAHAAAGDLRASARSDPAAPGLLVLAALPLCGGLLPSREAARSTAAESPAHQFACFHPIPAPGGVTAHDAGKPRQPPRAIRCSRSKTSSSNIPSAARSSTRCPDVSLAVRARRDAGSGRRVRLRQVDAGPRGAAVAPADLGPRAVRRPRPHGDAAAMPCARCAGACS